MAHFLDLFNHRTLSLFFQASVKYNLPLQYERNNLHSTHRKKTDTGLTNRQYIQDESLIFYSGLLSQQIRTTSGLQQILHSHFQIPVKIDQFVGQWQELIEDVRSRLPDLDNPQGRNVCLGRSAMIGKKGWFAQGKIHIILGPLNKKQLSQFSPGTQAFKALNELVRMYVSMENDYDFIIRVKKSDIPHMIQLNSKAPPIVSWNTWLSSKPQDPEDKDKTVDISVSAGKLQ